MADTLNNPGLVEQQDTLRSLRMFNSLLAGVGADQIYSGTDAAPVNAPGQFLAYGPYGASVEGQPIATYTQGAGLTVAPIALLAIGAAVLWYALKK